MPLSLLLDTDLGDDIDDALALALLLHSPEVELRGVTTVFRDAERRAQLTRYLLRAYGREDVPVVAGVSRPLLQPWSALHSGAQLGSQFQVLPSDLMGLISDPTAPHAIEFVREAIARHASQSQEKLTYLCVGPLTNLALLLAYAPELATQLDIVLMGGVFSGESHGEPWEWNIYCDPEAAAMVFQSGARLSVVPIDVTRQCVLSQEQTAHIESAPTKAGQIVGRMTHIWREENERCPTLHDPLAALTLFSDVVTWQDKRVEVGLCGAERGVTRFAKGNPNCRVALEVDATRAVDVFMQRVTA